MASDNISPHEYGLIIVGNSGVGKSFLANVLLGEEAFHHEFSPRSVTHRTEFREITIGSYRYAIFNIPGLIEADQTRVEVNKREIDYAFSKRPNSLVIYVFGQQNGRIRDEDVVAFDSINAAYPLHLESLLVVVNGLRHKRPKTYEAETIVMLQGITKAVLDPQHICFLEHLEDENAEGKVRFRSQLLHFILELTPTEHRKVQDICLRVDEVALLKETIENLTKCFEENKTSHEEEIAAQQKRYDDFVAQNKQEANHLSRIIEKQNLDNRLLKKQQLEQFENMRKAHKEQVSMMEKQMLLIKQKQAHLEERKQTANQQDMGPIIAALAAMNEFQAQLVYKMKEIENQTAEAMAQRNSSSCFIAGTQIRMADGTQKSIEDIQVGDMVLGTDHQHYQVMFLDVEQLQDRHLYSINGSMPFVTSEHVFLNHEGQFVAIDPQASEDEEPSLHNLVHRLTSNTRLHSFDQTPIVVHDLTAIKSDPKTTVYNVVLESGHTYFANDYAVFDMFPNLSQYPRMFKFLHLLWRQCATQIDHQFDDITTPTSKDRLRLEKLAHVVEQTISNFLANN